jgi:hypothetical protein
MEIALPKQNIKLLVVTMCTFHSRIDVLPIHDFFLALHMEIALPKIEH